jgi:uncharacterized protein
VQVRTLESIGAVSASEWNSLDGAGQPFLRHEFLAALEDSGCVGPGSGWIGQHLVARDAAGRLVGAMPLYRKSDSWGEFVFDFAWADAYRRAGLRYFPKLVSGVPFTPATGPRLLTAPGAGREAVAAALLDGAIDQARSTGASSVHVLFPSREEAEALGARGLLVRKDCQFHWQNRGYGSFDDFLGQFTAEKRKKAKRERRRVAEAGIHFRILEGDGIDDALWGEIMPLYASTFWRRGREPYLNEKFFRAVARALPRQFLVVLGLAGATPVAVALLFRSADTLYGRYWGSSGDYHSLHFETCYHQGIEYCIANGLQRFEPGTQGEHKVARGFEPTEVWSAHWLSDPRFAAVIDRYLDREREHIDEYIGAVQDHVPFRRETP